MAAYNLKQFMKGVEAWSAEHPASDSMHGTSVPDIDQWVEFHMNRPLNGYNHNGNALVMEALRGIALRYTLEVILRGGGELPPEAADHFLKTSFDDRCYPSS